MAKKQSSESSAEQVRTLKRLKQAAAGYLLGFKSARSLRDLTDVPRSADGTYDAASLVDWARARHPPLELNDDDVERTLQVVDWTRPDDGRVLLNYLKDMQRRHGDGGLLAYVGELMTRLRELASLGLDDEIFDESPPAMTRSEELELLERENRERLTCWYRRRLAIRLVCEDCNRVRRGRRWVRHELAKGEPSVGGVCPDCEQRRADR